MNIKEFSDKIISYCKENTKKVIIILCSALIFILIIILISIIISSKKNPVDYSRKEIVLTQEQLVPDGPEVQRDYNITRETKENWPEEEINKWFTIPSAKDIDSLQQANDNLASKIVGAAP